MESMVLNFDMNESERYQIDKTCIMCHEPMPLELGVPDLRVFRCHQCGVTLTIKGIKAQWKIGLASKIKREIRARRRS